MRYKTDSHINKIVVGDELLFDMDVGNGWKVTDVWFDHDIPVEKINCVKVKFERVKALTLVQCENCKYNPDKPHKYYDDDLTYSYAWCWAFIQDLNGEGYCPYGKEIEDEQ